MFTQEDLISSYTREQAIEDGVLIDVSETAKEAGFKYPVAVTAAVWDTVIEPDDKAKSHGESATGRLWDVLWMLFVKLCTIKASGRENAGTTIIYSLIATKDGRQHTIELKAECHGGDHAEPVLTIMLPNED